MTTYSSRVLAAGLKAAFKRSMVTGLAVAALLALSFGCKTGGEPKPTRVDRPILDSPTKIPAAKGGASPLLLLGTNVVTLDVPPTPGYPPPGAGSGTICGSSYCTYVNFPTNSSTYMPDAGTTKYVAKVWFASTNNPPAANTSYELRRRWGLMGTQCATNIGTTEKGHSCTVVAQRFTVYLKPGFCYPSNYPVYFTVDWQP